jgi:hypothetical protein
MKKAA